MTCTTHHHACDCREADTLRLVELLFELVNNPIYGHSGDFHKDYSDAHNFAFRLGYINKQAAK